MIPQTEKKDLDEQKLREKQKEEIKKRELEKSLVAVEDRLVNVEVKPEENASKCWESVFYLNIFMVLVSGTGAFFIKFEHSKVYESLTLLDSYDDGSFYNIMFTICVICGIINFMGTLITYVAIDKARRGRMRYMIYAFVTWLVAILIMLGTAVIQIIAIFLSLRTMFKDGFFMSMLLYGRVPEVAKKIHHLQVEGRCCGSFNYTEWFAITWSHLISKTTLNLPLSCCDLVNFTLDDCVMESTFDRPEDLTVSNRGCVQILEWYFKHILIVTVCIMVILTLFEFTIFMMSMLNLPSIKSYENLLIEERIKLALKRLEAHKRNAAGDEEEEDDVDVDND